MSPEEYRDYAGLSKINKVNNDLEFAELILDFIRIVSPNGNPIDKFYLARDLKLDGPIEELGRTLAELKSKDKKAVTDAVLVNLVVAKTVNETKAPNLQMRDIKKNILSDFDMTQNYLKAYEKNEQIDDVIDYFEDHPIKNSNELKLAAESDELNSILRKLGDSTQRLVDKSKKINKRTKVLVNLEKICDDLDDIQISDFKELTPDEYFESKEKLNEIKNIVNKLTFDLAKIGD